MAMKFAYIRWISLCSRDTCGHTYFIDFNLCECNWNIERASIDVINYWIHKP